MKTILILCTVVLLAGAAFLWHAFRMPSKYGTFTGAATVDVADVAVHPERYLHRTVALEGAVHDQCSSMGCFFSFHAGRQTLRVDLQEIAMNAPRREGHKARVEGQLVPYGGGYQILATAVEFR